MKQVISCQLSETGGHAIVPTLQLGNAAWTLQRPLKVKIAGETIKILTNMGQRVYYARRRSRNQNVSRKAAKPPKTLSVL